ncbi:MAG: ABC transporter substrate-binding protein [Lachnospiraceae bacterium]|jgi:NitT/TauT family transport system substrate-binding protein|nr:ABC transporter substrate-binding protein [Lachnospiraceae bacterium]
MKKTLTFISSLFLMIFIFTGCSSQSSSSALENTESKSNTPTENVMLDKVNVIALKGPTAMGMTKFMDKVDKGEITDYNYAFTISSSVDEVIPKIVQGKIDIGAVPANLASVLYNNTGGEVQVLAINTLGVLYIVESGNSISSIEDLKGKTIYASGKGSSPEYILNYILKQNGMDMSSDIQIEWKSEHTECLSALMAEENAIAMLPQPFVTTAQTKSENIRVAFDLTKEWDQLQTDSEAPSALITGVLVVRKEFSEKNPQIVSAFLDQYKESVQFINSHVEEGAKLISNYDIVSEEVAKKALPYCNITFIEGNEMKEKLSGYLSVLSHQNPKSIGDKLPLEDFYYQR